MQDRTAALTLIIAAVAGVAALEFALIVRLTRVPVSFRRWCAVGAAVAVEVVLVSLLLVLFPRPDDYIRAVLALCAGQGLLAISGMGIWMRYRG